MVDSIEKLIEEFSNFPGIGKKTAQRMAFFVLKQRNEESEALAQAILDVKSKVSYCSVCFNITEDDPCAICKDEKKDRTYDELEVGSQGLACSRMAGPGAGRHILDIKLVVERITHPLVLLSAVVGLLPHG